MGKWDLDKGFNIQLSKSSLLSYEDRIVKLNTHKDEFLEILCPEDRVPVYHLWSSLR